MAGDDDKAVEKAGDGDVDMAEEPDSEKSDLELDEGGNGKNATNDPKKEDSDGDSDGDDSEADDSEDEKEAAEEAERKALIDQVKARIASNPYDYQAHVQVPGLSSAALQHAGGFEDCTRGDERAVPALSRHVAAVGSRRDAPHCLVSVPLQPAACCLPAFCLRPAACLPACLLPAACCLPAFCLLPAACCLLHSALFPHHICFSLCAETRRDADVAKVEALYKRGVEEYVVSLSPPFHLRPLLFPPPPSLPPHPRPCPQFLCLPPPSLTQSLPRSLFSPSSLQFRSPILSLHVSPSTRQPYSTASLMLPHPLLPCLAVPSFPSVTPQSPPLWQAYLAFLTAHHPAITTLTPDGLKLFRTTAEQALSQVGLHLGEGASVWGTFRGFEMEVLRKMEGEVEKTKQAAGVRALFHRQLAVPHLQLPATLAAYLAWEEEEGSEKIPAPSSKSSPDVEKLPGSVKAAYLKAEKMVGERRGLEERVERLEGEKRRAEEEGGAAAPAGGGEKVGEGGESGGSGAVATFEKTDELMQAYTVCGDMPRQQAMHERAVTGLPVVFDVWQKYIDLVDHKLKVPSVVRSVYSRAARNCPWVGSLWTRYLLALERLGAADADIADAHIECQLGTAREGAPGGGATGAAGEAAGRAIWEQFVRKHGSSHQAWLGFTQFETERGCYNQARSVFRRCYSRKFDSPSGTEEVCSAWIRFEREWGTLGDLDLASDKVL
ncbi:unnamed protein product, partial [Closterium sp. NIES-54]